jgi:uncharacterized repeat protein (TIGR03803 family)
MPVPNKRQLLIKSFRFGVLSLLALIASAVTVFGQPVYTKLATLTCFYGQCQPGQPISALVEVSPGTFVGSLTFGVIYTISSAQQFQTIYTLPGTYVSDAGTPLQASDGNLYIPSTFNGTPSVYQYNFQTAPQRFSVPVPVGASPLIETSNFTLYGTSVPANTSSPIYTLGFDGTASVVLNVPQSLQSVQTLLQASDERLYGLTGSFTGAGRKSSLVRTDPLLGITVLMGTYHALGSTIIEASDGNFYGCGNGSFYRISKSGVFTNLHTFSAGPEGSDPASCAVQATDGNLYGTTYSGGVYGFGTIFQAMLSGQVTPVYSFTGADDQQTTSQYSPNLIQGSDGKLYGSTTGPYANSPGTFVGATIFNVDLGLPKPRPAITKLSPEIGLSGDTVIVMGKNLLGTTAVSFGSVPANFAVKAAQYLQVTVPSGARTGALTVTTPNGTAVSPSPFRVW